MAGGSSKDDRSFVLQYLAAEEYDVTIYGLPRGHYLKAAQYGQEDALARGLDLTQGAAGALELTISPNAAKVEGVVLNGRKQPASGMTVVLAPQTAQPGRADLYKIVTTDQTGHYSFESLPPGKYRLFAFEDMEEGAGQDADYLKEFEPKSEKIDVAEKAVVPKELLAIPAEERTEAR
ncbi:MAG: carboxypeptidase-like regulatory domain-containing protein [Bryobacteraceae bacterium]